MHPTNEIVELISNLILKTTNVQDFLEGYRYLHINYLKDLPLSKIINKYSNIRNNKEVTSRLICILNAVDACIE
jgi:hypothetical protein